jgi:hypothetical protein
LLTYSEVDDLEFTGIAAVKDILCFEVPVADVFLVHVNQGFEDLQSDLLQLGLVLDSQSFELRVIDAVHDQVADSFGLVEIQCPVPDDVLMSEAFHGEKVFTVHV